MDQSLQLVLTKLIELAQLVGSAVARIASSEQRISENSDAIESLQKFEGRILVLEASSKEAKSRLQFGLAAAALVVSLIATAFTIYSSMHAGH